MKFLDNIPFAPVVLASLSLGLAPFFPMPHVLEKLMMLTSGTLARPIDIADLLMHGAPWLILFAKLARVGAGVTKGK